ncbi:phospholipase D-like domain-containing protein [Collimonas pratensis]|nr:phospholipase D-like domain-containing protein [Collimonas pratensis]
MRKLIVPLAILLSHIGMAQAEFSIPGYELVHTAPVETTLATPDLREPLQVWSEMFDGAKHEIVLGQFYVASQPGAAFEQVIARLAAAGERGVKIRFLMEEKGKFASDMATIERLKKIPNLEFRYLDYSKLTGNGIIHAKYMVIDGSAAYVGSQNFDWRSFAHIHETGLRITDPVVVAQLQKIFEHDWQAQVLIAQGKEVPKLNQAVVAANDQQATFLVASPNAFNPSGVGDSETELPKLLAAAKSEVRIQLLDYAPLSYGPNRSRPYYAVIDNAIRAALARGVKVKLMVSNWNTEKPAIAYLQSLALLPGMEIRIVTLPQAGSGFIPFARVIHSKTMEIDSQVAWIGTSNWSGGYLDLSRNLEIVLRNEKMAQRIAELHRQTWDSAYAQPIDVLKDYPKPVKGKE